MNLLNNLPLASARGEIEEKLAAQKHLLLTAPTGTGKSSFLPYLLAGENKRVAVLQPRQLVARELAKFLSSHYGESVGGTVGYKFRFESKTGLNTRILFQTYGSFLVDVIHKDVFLDNWDWVIFDEFHERRAEMDLLLAALLAKGVRIAVLSAELERETLENYLGVKCLKIKNPGYPVDIIRQEPKTSEMLQHQVVRAVKTVLFNGIKGTVLVFLPGKAEIQKCRDFTSEALGKNAPELLTLFGGQLREEQNRIFEPSEMPRIVFTTNIAETSLTIPNVSAVIDSGFERIAADDEATGLKTLRLSRISLQNAVQRTGRAGRVKEGLCLRLWSEREEAAFSKVINPEIERFEPSRFLLQKALLEKKMQIKISLLSEIPAAKKNMAANALKKSGLLNENSEITEFGKRTLSVPVQSVQMAAVLEKQSPLACSHLILSLILESESKNGNALNLVQDFLENKKKFSREDILHFEQLQKWRKPQTEQGGEIEFLLKVFPNMVAIKSAGEKTYKNGNLAVFCEADEKAILPLGIMRTENSTVQKTTANFYVPVPESLLPKEESHLELQWNARQEQFIAVRISSLGVRECGTDERKMLENSTAAAWKKLMEKENFESLYLTENIQTLIAKMKQAAQAFPENNFPLFNEDDFSLIMEEFCSGVFLLRDLNESRFGKIIEDYFGSYWLDWLRKNFPDSLKLQNGKFAKYIYSSDIVEISARIGDFIGMQGEHFIAEKRVKVRYDILAPNYRTVQKTWNLTDFWKNTYPQVRKELRGRYPKHPWPESVYSAQS